MDDPGFTREARSKRLDYLKEKESGWVIERYINSELRYWDGRKTGDESFVASSLEAIRFSRQEDASKVLSWCLGGMGRVAEHVWSEERRDEADQPEPNTCDECGEIAVGWDQDSGAAVCAAHYRRPSAK